MDLNKVLFTFIKISFAILVVLLVIYAAVNLSGLGYDFGYRVFTESAIEEAPGVDILVQVKEDTSESELGDILEEKGLVRDSRLFYLQIKLSAYSGKLIPGVYTLNTSMTPKEMIVLMATAPEGEESIEDESGTEAEKETEAVPITEEE